MDERGVTFKWKDYRVKDGAKLGTSGKTRHKAMTLAPEEFIVAAPPAFICRHCGHAMNIVRTFGPPQ